MLNDFAVKVGIKFPEKQTFPFKSLQQTLALQRFDFTFNSDLFSDVKVKTFVISHY